MALFDFVSVEAEAKTTLPEQREIGMRPWSCSRRASAWVSCRTQLPLMLPIFKCREQEKQQLTIFYGGKVLVFNDFPADKTKGLMQIIGKGNPVIQNVSAPVTVTKLRLMLTSLLTDMSIARKASLHRFLEKRKDRLHAKAPYQDSPSDATPVKKEPVNQAWFGHG
nr:protein TIFY 10b-like [Lolium perenne]